MEARQEAAQVFLYNLHDLEEAVYPLFYQAVTSKRQERADRYYRKEDAIRCVMSEVLVRYVYHHIRNDKNLPDIVYPSQGKPYLSNDRGFHFSVSHTGDYVAVGYAPGEIGIDIEQINRPLNRKSIAISVFTPEEQAYVFGTYGEKEISETSFSEEGDLLRFAKLWTAKESYLKYLGCGFGKSPLSFFVNPEAGTICEKESGIVPGITVLGNRLSEDYYLTVCAGIKRISLEFVTYHSMKNVILQ